MPVYRFNVGQFECVVMKGGGMPRELSNLFPNVAKEELAKVAHQLQIDPEAIDFSLNIALVNTGSHLILMDTGIPQSDIAGQLKEAGIDPAQVDIVIVTHGHFDHVGGILDADGKFVYPNARYAIWKSEYDHWTAPEQLAKEQENPAIAVWKALRDNPDKLVLIDTKDEETEIAPGVCAIAAPGHTPGHIAVTIESGKDRLLHIVDAAHAVVQHSRTDWSPHFDYDKEQSAETRRKLFARAARDKAQMLAYHYPFPGLGHVTQDGDAFKWTPRQD